MLKLLGRWFGTVQVGNIRPESWFEVFNSYGAFNVILGKLWLHQVKAIHDYDTDTLTILQGKISETVMNKVPQAPSPTTNITENEIEKVETKMEKAEKQTGDIEMEMKDAESQTMKLTTPPATSAGPTPKEQMDKELA